MESRRFRAAQVCAVVVVAGFLTAMLLQPAGVATVSELGRLLSPLAAVFACAVAARRVSGRERQAWALLAACALSWAGGQAARAAGTHLGSHPMDSPSYADIGFLFAAPLAVVALLAFPAARQSVAARVRAVLDGVLVAAALLFVSWVVALGPVVRDAHSRLAQAFALGYPLADVVTVTIVAYALLRSRTGRGLPMTTLALIAAGIGSLAVADSGFVWLNAQGAYAAGSPLDTAWFAGWVLLALAARNPERSTPVEHDGRPEVVGTLVPYAAVPLAVACAVIELLRTGSLDTFLAWDAVAMLVVCVGRQMLLVVENHSLTRHLEQRVAVRTAELRRGEERILRLALHSSDVVTVVDAQGVVRDQSASLYPVFGLLVDGVVGQPFSKLLVDADRLHFRSLLDRALRQPGEPLVAELHIRDAGGHARTAETTATSLVDDPSVGGIVLNTRDVTERRVLERAVTRQALYDGLTGLANRTTFVDRLGQALASRGRGRGRVAVLLLDLDSFKALNDSLGHVIGDQLLIGVASRLQVNVRDGDTVARLGGDEFAVLVEDADDPAAAVQAAARLLGALREPLDVGAGRQHVQASVGLSVAEGAETAEELLRNAELAMYQAKAGNRGGWVRYAPDMHANVVQRVRLEEELRLAVARDELVLHYQPIVDLTTGEVLGAEALVRWAHPRSGLMAPLEFIPLAEETGLICEIGAWVLEQACAQAVQWQGRYGQSRAMTMSVNVSGRQLEDAGFVEVVRSVLATSGLPAPSLTLEVTESLLVDDDVTIERLAELRAMGVRIAIDDFGTGYSSLAYLHRFPIDVLKVDRSFVMRLEGEQPARDLVSMIMRLCDQLDLHAVAEGVETPGQRESLIAAGCTHAQGFYFAKPVPAEDLERILATHAVLGPSLLAEA